MSNSRDVTFGWSFPLFRVFGIAVRVHWLFVLWVGFQVMDSKSDWKIVLAEYGVLFGSVLLHEFGHSLACRSVGGKADRILLWPLGGLAECDPPLNPWAYLWTTLCGPLVNVLIMGVAYAYVAWAQHEMELETPLSLIPWDSVHWNMPIASRAVEWVMIVYWLNYIMLLFNMLFPCYPMDCGRVVQEILWLFIGYARSLWVTLHIGLAMAVVMVVLGFTGTFHMGTTSIVFGFLCLTWNLPKRRQLAALRDHYGSWSAIPDPRHEAQVGGWLGRLFVKPQSSAAAVFAPSPVRPDQAEIDRILLKVSAHGMASLTPEELAALKGAG